MPLLETWLPVLAMGGFRLRFWEREAPVGKPTNGTPAPRPFRRSREPLPPVLVVEGTPDYSLRKAIDAVAQDLHATVCVIEDVRSLVGDPDLHAVVGLVLMRQRHPRDLPEALASVRQLLPDRPFAFLTAQPTTERMAAALPHDPALVTPPLTADGLRQAFGLLPSLQS